MSFLINLRILLFSEEFESPAFFIFGEIHKSLQKNKNNTQLLDKKS